MKVLVIDDEALVRLSLRRALDRSGHQVLEAEDGQAGLEQWLKFQPDLVFLDVLMPRLSGPDLLKNIMSKGIKVGKVILMSAFTGEYDLQKAKSLGANMFILKPFDNIFSIVQMGEELVSG